MKVYCVLSLESPYWDDSNEYTQYTIFNIIKKNTQNYPKSTAMGIFPRDWSWSSSSSRGKQAISVWATEVLLQTEKIETSKIITIVIRKIEQFGFTVLLRFQKLQLEWQTV